MNDDGVHKYILKYITIIEFFKIDDKKVIFSKMVIMHNYHGYISPVVS